MCVGFNLFWSDIAEISSACIRVVRSSHWGLNFLTESKILWKLSSSSGFHSFAAKYTRYNTKWKNTLLLFHLFPRLYLDPSFVSNLEYPRRSQEALATPAHGGWALQELYKIWCVLAPIPERTAHLLSIKSKSHLISVVDSRSPFLP